MEKMLNIYGKDEWMNEWLDGGKKSEWGKTNNNKKRNDTFTFNEQAFKEQNSSIFNFSLSPSSAPQTYLKDFKLWSDLMMEY